jgi:hypothetical protein
MRRINYDTEQYQDYARGRALSEQQLKTWISFRRLEQAVAADPGASGPAFSEPLLTLERR